MAGARDVRRLVSAAGAGPDEVAAAIGDVGAERAADVLVDEVVFRATWPLLGAADRVVVRVALRHGGTTTARLVTATADGVAFGPDDGTAPDATVVQDLAEVVRLVFGPAGGPGAHTREIRLRDSDELSSYVHPPAWFTVVERLVAAVDGRTPPRLSELATRYGADKWGIHFYTDHYERHFAPLRHEVVTVLEIGVGGYDDPAVGGASLRMWKHYFPRGVVHGIDVHHKPWLSGQRLEVSEVDQSDPAALDRFARAAGPFDVVVDDGSHVNAHVLTSFDVLFPHLRRGGLYVVEDMQTAYWPRFGGSSADLAGGSTSTGLVKDLVDGLNHREIIPGSPRPPRGTDDSISELHVYHNIAFIRKGANREPGGPAWAVHGREG
ncbi:class I SAM-dependent methyltransferase [Saccharothrix syringae]|uniref:Class I SAM-dependent methyltransferase n=1 Tax=Saccharothrix syringae TaxID=103733 RepID=A0A5Q0GY58_SACSY|nr:class I SAM-dependent methyltransferase [Saccharothrix syringae]QFZ18292.1 class I SAM-dependent methyltransferase [Saccharothrix syringae]